MMDLGHCPMISKYGPSLSKAVSQVDPSFLGVEKNITSIKIFILQRVYELHKTENTCSLSIHKTKILIAKSSLMKLKRIAECSPWSILQYF